MGLPAVTRNISVTICGAAGRMGQLLTRLVGESPDLTLAGAVDRRESPYLGLDAGQVAGIGALGALIRDSFTPAADGARVYLDFSSPEGVLSHVRAAGREGVAAVIGVTGLGEEVLSAVREESARIPVVLAPNMSFGVNLMYRLASEAARILGREYEAEILEIHHNRKKDAPSGTAMELLARVAASRDLDPKSSAVFGRRGLPGPRAKDEIGVHALRGGDIVGEHTLLFAGPGETLTITHRALSRDSLAGGAVKAAAWVAGKPPGLYSFDQVLGIGD
ncbi:MAG: 4-hydroxy-tetrahydrodipicolinate reductase [Deltaproteobacteria bacterium]|jgi:4-hydroxy-tetrahydrodipicolinate reductase|nr:4-hydroxy-tetrahydrodipicolinate reductase [Deltaproteobacteria bacterium]